MRHIKLIISDLTILFVTLFVSCNTRQQPIQKLNDTLISNTKTVDIKLKQPLQVNTMNNSVSHKKNIISLLQTIPDDADAKDVQVLINNYFTLHAKETGDQPKAWSSWTGRLVFLIASMLGIITIYVVTDHFSLTEHPEAKTFDIVAYCFWTIMPPVWFMFEYKFIFPDKHKLNSTQLTDLKYTHELASKIWASLVLIMTIFFYIKYHTGSLWPK